VPKPYFIGDLQTRNHQTITQGTLVLGGPGTGKTTLIEDRIAQARQRGLFEGGVVLAEPGTINRMLRPGIDIVSTVGAPLSAEDVRKFISDFHSPGSNWTVSGKWLFVEKEACSPQANKNQAMLVNSAIEALMADGSRGAEDPICHFIVDGLESVPGINQLELLLARGRTHGVASLVTALCSIAMVRAGYNQDTLRLAPQTVAYFACHDAEIAQYEGQSFKDWHCQSGMHFTSGATPAKVEQLARKLADELRHLKPLEAIIHERPYGVEMERANFQCSLFSKLEMAARKDFGLMHFATRSATDQLDATYR
jgi:hypothetical protein